MKKHTQSPISDSAVALFKLHTQAEGAIKALQQANFDMKKLSIVGRDYHTEENVVGYYNNGDRMLAWGKLGAFWGGIWGLLFGSAFFWLPGVGQVVVAGPLVGAIVSALEGATLVGGLNALGAGLFGLGIPKDSVLHYQTAIGAGNFALIVHGSATDVALAQNILRKNNAVSVDGHELSTVVAISA